MRGRLRRQRYHRSRRISVLKLDNFQVGYVNIAGFRLGTKIHPRNISPLLAPFVANLEAVAEYGDVGRKCP